MEIDNSSLWREVIDIVSNGENPVHLTWSLTIHANNKMVVPFKVLSVDIDRDYLHNYSDAVLVTVVLPLGTYIHHVYPHLDHLDIELTRQHIGEASDIVKQDIKSQTERYTATFIDEGNSVIESALGTISSEEELNRFDVVTVKFQLLNKLLEQIRVMPAGGIYRNMTGEELIKALMTKASRQANLPHNRKLKGVDMVPASNQKKRETLIIPHGIPVVEVPHHVHYHCGGVYSSGLGYFLQGDHWYVFPAYDTTRFSSGQPTLTIVNVPPRRMPLTERTYRKDGDNLVILATGDTSFRERRNQLQLNEGNGIRFADANAMMEDFVVTKGNKTVARRSKSNTEMLSEKRKNELDYVTAANRGINANAFVEYSALAARQGHGMSLVWENANTSLLYPGMPVRLMYLDGDKIKTLDGVLLGSHEYVSLREPGMTSSRYVSSSTLSVFLKPNSDTPLN